MPIRVKCSNADCGKLLNAKDELAGKAIKCPGCQTVLRVPASAGTPQPAATAPKPAAAASVKAAPPPAAKAPPAPARPAAKPPALPAEQFLELEPVPAPASAKGARPKPPKLEPQKSVADDPSENLWAECAMLQHERFMVKPKMFNFLGPRLWYISNPDTKEQLGLAKERWNVLKLFFAFCRRWLPTWVDVRETDDGPVLFTLCQLPRLLQFLPITIVVYNHHKERIGYFKTKVFSLLGGFWVYDDGGQKVAEVKGQISLKAAPRIQFLAQDGRELATISSEVWEAMAQKKIKIVWGDAGFTITLTEELQNQPRIKVLLLACAVALELTGVMKTFKK